MEYPSDGLTKNITRGKSSRCVTITAVIVTQRAHRRAAEIFLNKLNKLYLLLFYCASFYEGMHKNTSFFIDKLHHLY
jgi:hypothetical protein